MTDSSLVLLAFAVFSTALVLVYLVALWIRPRAAWAATIVLVATSVGCFVLSEQQAAAGVGDSPGLRTILLGAILAIAGIGAMIGAGYGTWKARQL